MGYWDPLPGHHRCHSEAIKTIIGKGCRYIDRHDIRSLWFSTVK